jgi:hypothetical protein
MESRSIFISSLTRRQLVRRRPTRSPVRAERVMVAVLIALAITAVIVARGGL